MVTRGYTILFKAITFALIGLTLFMLALSPGNAAAVVLKDNAILTEPNITLGDIFNGLERDQDHILGAAPRPGQDMTLNARTLMRIAVAMDLPWRPNSMADQIVLRRPATIISKDALEETLESALEQEGLTGNFRLNIPEGLPEIALPLDQPETLEVTHMTYDPARKWFEADIAAPSKDNPIKTISVKGNVETLISVPVLTDTFRKGMVIGKHDITYIDMPENKIKHDMILQEEELLGMTPRRVANSGEPLSLNEIEAPIIVTRGDMITMIFNDGPIYLTARGKALEHGAKGDVIRVVNPASNQTVEGTVTADKEITIRKF